MGAERDTRFTTELVRALAMALQLIGCTDKSPKPSVFDAMLSDERVTAALDERDIDLLRVCDELASLEVEHGAELAAKAATLLPEVASKLLSATPLKSIGRLSTSRTFTAQDTVADALAFMGENGYRYLVHVPERGEPGLISRADIALWFVREVEQSAYEVPVLSATSVEAAFDVSPRTWRVVDEGITVAEARQFFSRAERRVEAALVLAGGSKTVRGIVTVSDFELWQRPSRSMRDRVKSLLSSRRALAQGRNRGSVAPDESLEGTRCALLSLEPLRSADLVPVPGAMSSCAATLREMLAGLGAVGAGPAVLLDALHGTVSPQVVALRLDTTPAFGSGRSVSAGYVGEVLQRLADAGLVADAGRGALRCSAAWRVQTDLSWLDAVEESEAEDAPSEPPATPVEPALVAEAAGLPAEQATRPDEPPAAEATVSLDADDTDQIASEEPKALQNKEVEHETSQIESTNEDKSGKKHGNEISDVSSKEPEKAKRRNGDLKPLPYVAYAGKRETGDFFKAANLLSTVLAVIRAEGPIASELLMRRVAGLWGIPKVTAQVRGRFSAALPQTGSRGGMLASEFAGTVFYMTPDQKAKPQVRTNTGSKSGRSSAEIPFEELRVVIVHLLSPGSMPRARLVTETCKMFGLDAKKQAPKKVVEAAIARLVEKGTLAVSGKTLELAD